MNNSIDYANLQIGDILYEFFYTQYVESRVITVPVVDGRSISWDSENTLNGEIINYMVNLDYMAYAPKLYRYIAYAGCEQT